MGNENAAGTGLTTNHGTLNYIEMVYRDANQACSTVTDRDMYGSTAEVALGGLSSGDLVEAGWRARFNSSGTLVYRAFTENVNLGIATTHQGISFPCSYVNGAFRAFETVNNPTSGNHWDLYMWCSYPQSLDGGYDTSYNFGTSEGEDFRRGGTLTGMGGQQFGLQIVNRYGNLAYWNNNHCDWVATTASNWHWSRIDNTSYNTVKGSATCNPL